MSGKKLFLIIIALAAGAGAYLARSRTTSDFIARPTTFVTDLAASEKTWDAVSKSISKTFVRGIRERDWALVASSLAGDFRGRFPAPSEGAAIADPSFAIRAFAPGTRDLDASAFVAVLREHVEGWSTVERATFRGFEHLAATDGSRSYVRAHMDLGGARADRTRAILKLTVEAEVVPSGDSFKLRRFALVSGHRAEASRPPFPDITDAVGLKLTDSPEERKLIQELIDARRTPYWGGLTICDWNHDGLWDVIATVGGRQTVLFLNDGKGGFTRSDELPIKKPEESPFCLLFVDLDGDGQEELVSGHVDAYEGDKAWLTLYKKKPDGSWEKVPRALELANPPRVRDVNIQSIVPVDLDGDGKLDLFCCAYDTSESKSSRFNRVSADDGARNLLFMNKGGLKFAEESEQRGITGTRYTYVARIFDFDGRGKPDVFEGNDFGANRYWRNKGDGTFTEQPDHPFASGASFTMGVTMSDYDNRGDFAVHVSNMYSHAGNRIVPLASAGLGPEMRRRLELMASGNQLFEKDANGKWVDRARERGVDVADWAWACLFADLQNDTRKDLLVTNGYTSNEDRTKPDY